jgi:hypothetical protein
MDISAEAVLRSYNQSSRQQMARSRGLSYTNKGTEALIALLKPVLYSPAALHQALTQLSPAERALLDHLILLGGEGPLALLQRLLEEDGLVDKDPKARDSWGNYREVKGSPWPEDSRNFGDVVARLGVLGLVYSSNPGLSGAIELARPGYHLYIPDEVLAQLPPVELPVETVSPPTLVRPADPAALLRDIYVLLSVAGERPIPLTKAGLIVKRALVQINGLLQVQEEVADARSEEELSHLPFLRALAEDLRLLVPRQGDLHLGDNAPAFLAQPRALRRQQLYAAYQTTGLWCEVFQLPGLSVRTAGGRRPVPEPVVAARQRVLAEIAALPAERWITVEHLVSRMRRRAYEFLFPRRQGDRYMSGFLSQPNPYSGGNALDWTFEQIYSEASGWERVEAGFIRTVATQALPWLGILDLGFHDDQPVAFRITADGARLLHGVLPAESVAAAPNVVIQPNFQLFAFEPTDESVLFRLDQVAERVRLEKAGEYRLTRESVYRAQRAGWSAEEVLRFLDEVSTVPLPQNVRRSIEEWGAEQERVVIRRGMALLQAVDAPTLDALYADTALAPLLGRRVTSVAALVPPANLTTLYQKLLERDQIPALSEGPEEGAYPAFTVAADGTVAFQEPVPSIFVLRELRPFVDGTPPAAVRLTEESLRRAAQGGMTPEEILTVLDDYGAGEMPPAIATLVRRWAKDWGRGALADVTLLQVEQSATLGDLLTDPAVKRYLTPVPQSATLAVVRQEGVAAVRAALAARGVELDSRLFR